MGLSTDKYHTGGAFGGLPVLADLIQVCARKMRKVWWLFVSLSGILPGMNALQHAEIVQDIVRQTGRSQLKVEGGGFGGGGGGASNMRVQDLETQEM